MASETQINSIARIGCSVEEAAEALGISRSGAYKLLEGGRLRSAKIGKRRIVLISSIQEFLEALASEEAVFGQGVNHD